jgi:hypothetical protein
MPNTECRIPNAECRIPNAECRITFSINLAPPGTNEAEMRVSHRYFNERTLFFTAVAVMCIPALTLKYFLTLDGPSHLYNASVIRELLFGKSQLIAAAYQLNPVTTPNWTGHLILALLGSVFSGWFTEKIFILLNLVLLPVSFRYFVGSVAPGNRNLSCLSLPFSYTFLFQCGFFNFCLAFIIMFLTAGWWYRRQERPGAVNIIALSILLTISFFSHPVVFAFTGALLGMLMIASCAKESSTVKEFLLKVLQRAALLLLASLPSLALMGLFLTRTTVESPGIPVPKSEMWQWLLQVRPLLLFNITKESEVSTWFNIVWITIIGFTLYRRIGRVREERRAGTGFLPSVIKAFEISDSILLLAVFAFILYFTVPYNSGAGVMSDRLVAVFFIIWVLWLALQPLTRWVRMFVVTATLTLTMILLIEHYPSFRHFSQRAQEFEKASGYIGDETIVLPVNWEQSWLLGHSSGYLADGKRIVLLDNYEAITSWFPVCWKIRGFPEIRLGDRTYIADTWWYGADKQGDPRTIDYVVIYGNTAQLEEPVKADLKKVLEEQYRLAYRSQSGFIEVFTLKQKLP